MNRRDVGGNQWIRNVVVDVERVAAVVREVELEREVVGGLELAGNAFHLVELFGRREPQQRLQVIPTGLGVVVVD